MRKIPDTPFPIHIGDQVRIISCLADDLIAAAPDMLGHLGDVRIIPVLLLLENFPTQGIIPPVAADECGVVPGFLATEITLNRVALMSRVHAEPEFHTFLS